MDINWSYILNSNFFSIVVPAIIAIFGWWRLSIQKIKEKRREIAVEHLIYAHRILSNWVGHNLTPADQTNIEGVIADIQLLGSNKTISTLNEFLDCYKKDNSGNLTNLLDTLVSELRIELKMESINSKRIFFRFN